MGNAPIAPEASSSTVIWRFNSDAEVAQGAAQTSTSASRKCRIPASEMAPSCPCPRGRTTTRAFRYALQIINKLGGEHGDARFRVARCGPLRDPRDFRDARDVLQQIGPPFLISDAPPVIIRFQRHELGPQRQCPSVVPRRVLAEPPRHRLADEVEREIKGPTQRRDAREGVRLVAS